MPAWAWSLVFLLLGYAVGFVHRSCHTYCPRCLYYLNWRDTVLGSAPPLPRSKEPWDRDIHPRYRE